MLFNLCIHIDDCELLFLLLVLLCGENA